MIKEEEELAVKGERGKTQEKEEKLQAIISTKFMEKYKIQLKLTDILTAGGSSITG